MTPPVGPPVRWTREAIIGLLKRAYRDLKEPMTLPRLRAWGTNVGEDVPSQPTITKRCGSWHDLCVAAKVPNGAPMFPGRTGPEPIGEDICWAAARAFLVECERAGRPPTVEMYEVRCREMGWPTRNTLARRLGMSMTEVFRKARARKVRAAPTVDTRKHSTPRWSTKDLVEAMGEAFGDGTERLTLSRYRDWADRQDHTVPTVQEIRVRFGSWDQACRAAGVVSGRVMVADERVREGLVAAYDTIGDPFSVTRYRDLVREHPDRFPGLSAVLRVFGTWDRARRDVGAPSHHPRYSDEDYFAALRSAAEHIGGDRFTTVDYARWRTDGSDEQVPRAESVIRRYGSWRAALVAAEVG